MHLTLIRRFSPAPLNASLSTLRLFSGSLHTWEELAFIIGLK